MKKYISLLIIAVFFHVTLQAQSTVISPQDSLQNNLINFLAKTTIGGYGNVRYQNNFNESVSNINLERFVLFVGHKFNDKFSLFSELEVEDAKVAGGEEGGEVALEQCYVQYNINPGHYLVAGLYLPRIGILNENHLPVSFFGNERTQVETWVIPSTWRELGVGYYGTINPLSLSYSLGVVNGLNSAGFEHGTGIRDGRYEGSDAAANNLAVTGSLQFNKNNFTAQVSGYYGGSVGLSQKEADTLHLTSGIFGTPVILTEANIQYSSNGFSARALASMINIPDASDLNAVYESNTPESIYGFYIEAGYNLFHTIKKLQSQELDLFARYEGIDLNSKTPANGSDDPTLVQQHVVVGLNYLPIKNVVIKADVRLLHTGKRNDASSGYEQNNTLLNLGIGYSF